MRLRIFALLALIGAAPAVFAQTCELPHPFDRTSAIRGTVAFVAGDSASCDLDSTLTAANSTPSGAFAWYSIPGRPSTLRISFRIDTSQYLGDGLLDGVDILAVTSRSRTLSPHWNSVLRIGLVGDGMSDPTSPFVEYLAACGNPSCGNQPSSGVLPAIANGDMLGIEISVGAGADGWIHFWENADFSDPPTFALENLDNGALAGPEDIAIGAFNMTASLAAKGAILRFSDISSSDDILFWSDFDE